MRPLLSVLLLSVSSALLWAQEAAGTREATAPGEFPGLQLLPPGSTIENITLPRYDHHRLAALLKAEKMNVLNRREVSLHGISASMFNTDGTVTKIKSSAAIYNFTSLVGTAPDGIRVADPRFKAQGSKLIFDTKKDRGILLGPVRTSFNTRQLSRYKK